VKTSPPSTASSTSSEPKEHIQPSAAASPEKHLRPGSSSSSKESAKPHRNFPALRMQESRRLSSSSASSVSSSGSESEEADEKRQALTPKSISSPSPKQTALKKTNNDKSRMEDETKSLKKVQIAGGFSF